MIKKIVQQYQDYSDRGFMMPAVLIVSSALFLIGMAGLQLAQATFTDTFTEYYGRLAQEAAKAGIDFAKDKYEANQNETFASYASPADKAACNGLSNGQKVNSTSNYCAAFGITQTTTTDGTKRIQSTGTVFVGNQKYSRTVIGILNRKTTSAATPDQYGPLIWIDANDSTTVNFPEKRISATSSGQVRNENLASPFTYVSNSTIANLGTYSGTSVYTGISFNVASLPATATIKGAYIKFANSSNRDVSNTTPLVERIKAIAEGWVTTAAPTCSFGTATGSRLGAAGPYAPSVDWDVTTQPFGANAAGSNFYQTIDVTSLVQQSITAGVSAGTWSGTNDCVNFRLEPLSGSGFRAFYKFSPTPPQLYIVYETSPAHSAPASGSYINNIMDKSGNNNYFTSVIAPGDTGLSSPKWYPSATGYHNNGLLSFNKPSGVSGTAVSGNMLLFGGGPLRAAGQRTGQTVFIVGEPRTLTTGCASSCAQANQDQEGTFASIFANGSTGFSGGTAAMFGSRGGLTNTPANICTVTFGSPSLSACQSTTWSTAKDNSATTIMVYQSADNTGLRQLNIQNGIIQQNLGAPTTNYNTYSYDTYYALGTNAQYSGYANFEGTIGDFIVYDKYLTCADIKTIVKYLSNKWSISTGSDIQCQNDVFF